MEEVKRVTPGEIGSKDRRLEGWFDGANSILAPGVHIRATDTVVDVGCGDGALIDFCSKMGAEVFFIDRDEARLATTEAKIKANSARSYRAIQSDCDPIPLGDCTGDVVICTEVLEHVADPARFLDELIRVAKPGAQLLITVPDSRSEQFVSATAPPQYFQEPNHIRIFSAQEFEDLLQNAGLEIERHYFMGCFWSIYWPLSWLTCEPGLGQGLPVDNRHPITEHWRMLWLEVQNHPQGHKIRDTLNQLLPKAQSVVARKPL